MKKILILQFRTTPATVLAEQQAFVRCIENRAELLFKNAITEIDTWDRPLDILADAQGVILGGSGEFDFDGGREHDDEQRRVSHTITEAMTPFLQYLESTDFPTLAICFGHQIIGTARGVQVQNDLAQTKVGTHPLMLTDEGKRDVLFTDVPDVFVAQYGHKDSLSELPQGAVLLARGACCFYSALRFGKRQYTCQFHPELCASDLREKFISHPDYLPPGTHVQDLIQESPDATKILLNFVERVVLDT